MAASIENVRVIKVNDPDSRYQDGGEVQDADTKPSNKLDSPEIVAKLRKLEDWFEQERSRQAENRFQMALDQDFYDGLQYSEEDAQELIERGQAPLVYNEIKPTIDWVIGTERRTKFDFNVLPRTNDDVQMASVKRDVMKYISDVNRTPFERSQSFKECVISGLGWMEDGVRGDNEDDPLFSQQESWRNVWYDSNSIKLDLSDARYLFRRKVIDLDIAYAMFPDRKEILRSAAMDQDSFSSSYDDEYYIGSPLSQNSNGTTPIGGFSRHASIGGGGGSINRRERVELIEAWSRSPSAVQKMRGELLNGEIFDSANAGHVDAINNGSVSLFDSMEMKIEVSIFCKGGMLSDCKSPYRHNRFSLTPMWCYRRGRDNAPYGMVRNIRDPQEDLNKRASKALFILSTNQVIAEAGAVDDWDQLREEVSRPDGVIIKNKGKELEIRQDKQLAEQHLRLMDRDGNAIRNAGGVTDENLGRGSNAQSGKAILARQTQGSVVTAEVFDNYLLAFQIHGENLLSLAEQYYTLPKVIRLTDSKKGAYKWSEINQPQPDGTYLNDITNTKSDFLVDEQDYRESMRQAMFEQMMTMLSGMQPDVALSLMDLVFEFSDVQGKDEIVARIRKLNGQSDPNQEQTPEQLAEMDAAQKQEQASQEMAQRAAEANIKLLEAKVEQIIQQNNKTDVEAMFKRVESMFVALQAGQTVATVQGVANVADEILVAAGFKDQAGNNAVIPEAQVQQVGMQPPATSSPESPQISEGAMQGIETTRNDSQLNGE